MAFFRVFYGSLLRSHCFPSLRTSWCRFWALKLTLRPSKTLISPLWELDFRKIKVWDLKMLLMVSWGSLGLVLGAFEGFLEAPLVLLRVRGGTLNSQNFFFGLPRAPILAPEESPTAPSGSWGPLMARQMPPRSHQGSSGDVVGPIFWWFWTRNRWKKRKQET